MTARTPEVEYRAIGITPFLKAHYGPFSADRSLAEERQAAYEASPSYTHVFVETVVREVPERGI